METEKLIAALREDAKILGSSGHGYGGMAGTNRRAADLLESQQARITELEAQLAESQRTGRWAYRTIKVQQPPDIGDDWEETDELYCTACGAAEVYRNQRRYCPNCGAHMIGG